MCFSDTSHHFILSPQTTEDGRERKTLDGAAEEENGERGSEDDEERAKNRRQALVTLRSDPGEWGRGKDTTLSDICAQAYLISCLKRIITP